MYICLILILAFPNRTLKPFHKIPQTVPTYKLFKESYGAVFDSTYPYDVLHYNIQIELNFPGTSISHAFTEITAKTVDTLSVANFNFVGLNIDSVLVDGVQATYNRIGSGVNEILAVTLGRTLSIGDTFTVGVSYSGTPEQGIYYTSFNGGMTYVMSIPSGTELPVGARYWFPCYDAFNDKATSELSITVPSGYEVVANGYLESVDTAGTQWTYHWAENYPIPTWYIVFSVSDYVILRDSVVYGDTVVPIIYFVTPAESSNALIAFSNVPDMLTFYSDIFGDKYPFFKEKYSIVRAPCLGFAAMEYQTSVFFGLPIPAHHGREIIIAHETAHQWWACSITPGTLKDIWLNEGFATYCEALYSDHWTGGISYHDYMIKTMHYYLANENRPLGHPFPTYDPPEAGLWSVTTYQKPASVLHMLRHIVGDSTFFEILKTYYATYKYKNAITSEFQSIAEAVSGKSLGWFFDEWIYKAGHPDYEYAWQWDSLGVNNFRVDFYVNQVQSHSWNVPTFKMPIDIEIYTTRDTTKFVAWDSLDNQAFTFYVDSKPESLIFDSGDWILKTKKLIGVEEEQEAKSKRQEARLEVYPNPFTQKTVIRYSLNDPPRRDTINDLQLTIYDLGGRIIKTFNNLANQPFSAGDRSTSGGNQICFNAKGLTSGIYFAKLVVGNYKSTKKLILVR